MARGPQPDKTRGAAFPKSAKLLRPADFERVYERGARHTSSGLMVIFLRREEAAADTRIGLTVGRAMGGAVVRNRMKRRLREAVQRHRHELPGGVDVVLHPRKPALKADFEQLAAQVGEAFTAIHRKLQQT